MAGRACPVSCDLRQPLPETPFFDWGQEKPLAPDETRRGLGLPQEKRWLPGRIRGLPVRVFRRGVSKCFPQPSCSLPAIACLRRTAPTLSAYAWTPQAIAMVFLTEEKIT